MSSNSFRELTYLSCAAVALAAFVAPAVVRAQDAAYQFDIPSQDLGSALRAFGRTARQPVIFNGAAVRGKTSEPLVGRYRVDDGLRTLLGASGSAFRRGANGVLIVGAENGSDVQAQGDEAVSLDEIVVTANKREQLLRDVPQSVTVVGGNTLEQQKADNFEDYVNLVPGLSMTQTEKGGARLILRGVNAGGAGSTIALYVDETPFGSSSGLGNGAVLAGDFDTFDISRVEVLRGPQGTLYGASSLGGVLKFVTNAPDPSRFEGRIQGGAEAVEGGGMSWSANGMINAPLGDKAAIRASAYHRDDAGFIDSIGTDDSIVDEDVNGSRSYGARLSALIEPTDNLRIRLSAVVQNTENDASSWYEADPETLAPLYGGLTLTQYKREFTEVGYRLYNGTLEWDLGFATLLSSTSYGTLDQSYLWDSTAYFGGLLTTLYGDPVTRPLGSFQPNQVHQRKFTQEVRLASPSNDTFEWMVGAYYTRETAVLDQALFAFERDGGATATDLPLLYDALVNSSFKEYAAFANGTLHITPRFEVTVGGRLSRNQQRATQVLDGELVGGLTAYDEAKSSESVFTYSVAPRFELNDTTSVYARVASGYRPGGPNILPPGAPPGTPTSYNADSLTSYEIGLKGDFLDNALSLDISAYYLDWQDIQLVAVINDIGINANGGSAESRGVEFSLTARPMRGLTLLFSGAYIDATLSEDTPSVVGGLAGDELPYTPNWTLSVSGDYEWPVFGDATAWVGGTFAYVGDQPTDFDTDYVATFGRRLALDSYERIDLRAGLDIGRWSVSAYVRNLTDARGQTYAGGLGSYPNGAIGVGVIRPRTIGLSVGAKF